MRLANGIIIDKEKTFGVLKFSALRREVHTQNEDVRFLWKSKNVPTI